jgi:hypothetical protein
MRELSDETDKQGRRLSPSTLSSVESGKHLPKLEVVEAFTRGCGVDGAELATWRHAWATAAAHRRATGKAELVKEFDFFISYAIVDKEWAEWIAWQLIQAGYRVELPAWDWRPGENLNERLSQALTRSNRVIVVLSPHYLDSKAWVRHEADMILELLKDVHNQGRVLPVVVADVEHPNPYSELIAIYLVGVSAEEAGRRLISGLQHTGRPPESPKFPGSS